MTDSSNFGQDKPTRSDPLKARLEKWVITSRETFGNDAFTNPDFVMATANLAKKQGLFADCAKIRAHSMGKEDYPDFERDFFIAVSKLGDAASPGDTSPRVPVDLTQYAWDAYLNGLNPSGPLQEGDTELALKVLAFLEGLPNDPKLAQYRLIPRDTPSAKTYVPPTHDAFSPGTSSSNKGASESKAPSGDTEANELLDIPGLWEQELLNKQVREYRVIKLISQGGMGIVYLVIHVLDQLKSAMKISRAMAKSGTEAESLGERARQEIRLHALLGPHKNIVAYQNAFVENGRLVMVMEYVEGGQTVMHLIKKSPNLRLSPERILHLGKDVCSALEVAHAKGIIHRDLKPENILFDPSNVFKVADFGIALFAQRKTRHTEVGEVVGTPGYMSPEQAAGLTKIDARSDIYSLGAVLYHAATGIELGEAAATDDQIAGTLSAEPGPIREQVKTFPEDLQAVVVKALEKSPSARWKTAAEMRAALEACRIPSTDGGSQAPQAPERSSIGKVAAALILIAAIILLIIFFPRGDNPAVVEIVPPTAPPTPGEHILVKVPSSPTPTPGKDANSPQPAEPMPKSPPKAKPEPPKVIPKPPPKPRDPIREVFENYAVSPEEMGLIRKMWATVAQEDAHIQAHQYAPLIKSLESLKAEPASTPYTGKVITAQIQQIKISKELYQGVMSRVKPGSTLEFHLIDGRTLTGELTTVNDRDLVVKNADSQKSETIPRSQIAEGTYYSHAPVDQQLLYRATHGEPGEALRKLRGFLDPKDEVHYLASILPHVPGITHSVTLRAVMTTDGGDLGPAQAVAKDLSDFEEALPAALRYATEPRKTLAYEIAAKEAFLEERFEVVLTDYERSRVFPRAVSGVYSRFSRTATVERLAGGEFAGWTIEPKPEGFITFDDKAQAFIIQGTDTPRQVFREIARATAGYVLTYRFDPYPLAPKADPAWGLILTSPAKPRHLQVTGTASYLAFYDTPKEGKDVPLVAQHDFGSPGGFHTLTVFPVGKLLLVFDGKELVLKLSPKHGSALAPRIQLGVTKGTMRLRSLKVSTAHDE